MNSSKKSYNHNNGNDNPVITPIQRTDIQRIVAGQAINDIASAVKELIDNALDAKAKSINIRLFNQGVDVIEVSDDGSGVPVHSRHMMAKKHATSKIRSFDELYEDTLVNGNIETKQLGFRGEALFSLANVSQNLVVSTKTSSDRIGQKLEFTREGLLKPGSTAEITRKVGTTVAIVKLFDALPVRRADLIKRIKTQRAKLLRLIQSYAVLCHKVRFNLVDIKGVVGSAKCRSEVKLSTSGNSNNFASTISTVFGSKFLTGLCQFKVDLSPLFSDTYMPWRIEGLISQAPCMDLNGRIARDIQFFCINGRPVEIPRLSRVIGNVWRNYETSGKRPACILALYLPNKVYDVNLVPDKRQVLLTEETAICDSLQNALSQFWSEQSDGKFRENEVINQSAKKRALDNQPRVESWEMKRMKRMESQSATSSLGSAVRNNIIQDGKTMLNKITAKVSHDMKDGITSTQPIKNGKRRMQRRNAFVNSFENIGSAAPDNMLQEDISMLNQITTKAPQDGKEDVSSIKPASTSVASNPQQHTQLNQKITQFMVGRDDLIDPMPPQDTKTIASDNDIGNEKTSHQNAEKISLDSQPRVESWEMRTMKRLEMKRAAISNSLHNTDLVVPNNIMINKVTAKVPQDVKEEMVSTQSTYKHTSDSQQSIHQTQKVIQQKSYISNPVDSIDPTSTGTKTIATDSDIGSNKPSCQSVEKRALDSQQQIESWEMRRMKRLKMNQYDVNSNDRRGSARPNDMIQDDTSTRKKITTKDPQGGNKEMVSTQSTAKHSSDPQQPINHTQVMQQKSYKVDLVDPMPLDDANTITRENNSSEKKPVIWANFEGTDSVIEKSQNARLRLLRANESLKRRQDSEVGGSTSKQSDVESDEKAAVSTDGKNSTVSLSREDFQNMRIIGQFNLGFILAMFDEQHLFIIDQHASDEIHNFEKLLKETVLTHQNLISPLPLELSPSEENCILEHKDIFERNGFKFVYNEDKEPRHRISLIALPHSEGGDGYKPVQFGKEDVEALCAMLGADGAGNGYIAGSGTGADGSGASGNNAVRRHIDATVRPPKAIAMFASRACRKSIMIGDSLSQKQMEKIVENMKNAQQPWTCPHGRPTIRHVKSLLQTLLKEYTNQDDEQAGAV